MRLKSILLIFTVLICLLGLMGCDTGQENPNKSGQLSQRDEESPDDCIPLNIDVKAPVSITLEDYEGGFFTMRKPKGWIVETTGEYENFGIRVYDSVSPAKQIFFYGNMRPFLKSLDAKKAWEAYIAGGGYASSQMYADAPVLMPATVEQFFYIFNEFTLYASNYGINHLFPSLNNLEVIESTGRDSQFASVALDDSIIRGLFVQDNIPCEGLFAASVADTMKSYMYDVDAGYYTVYLITGISAPADEFYLLEEELAESLSSFQFTEEYIQQGVAHNIWETKMALQVSKTLSEASDSYNNAWSSRQKVNDALSQKRSDAALGYDRLYDTETGDIYRAELGFYDEYDLQRDEYVNPNLQIVSEDDYSSYEKEVYGYINK